MTKSKSKSKTLTMKKPDAKTSKKKDNVQGNIDKTKKRLTETKDLKYQYPKDISTLEARKKFRGNNRSRRDSFMKKIANAENSATAKNIQKEANAWAETIFTKLGMPSF